MDEFKRLKELADRSYQNGQYVFTDFMTMAELAVFYENERELAYACPVLSGGYEGAERQMIRFGSEEELGYSMDFPIDILRITPVMEKFADDLNHRDFLGALMNLGIKREMTGDIVVRDREAICFCRDTLSPFIIESLSKVKHTSVKVEIVEDPGGIISPERKEKVIQVQSNRIDAVAAKVYGLSRQDALSFFAEHRVFLNGRECTGNAKTLKPGDIISIRGKGRFEYAEELNFSKKGKLNCKVMCW